MTLLLVILGLTFELFLAGGRAFTASDRQHDLSRDATVVLDRVTRSLESARPDSLTVEASAVSFLTCRDANNRLVLNHDGTPLWQAYDVFFLDAPRQELKERRETLVTPTSELQPIERYDPGGGRHPLAFYRNSRDVVARRVTTFALQRPQPDRVELRLRLELPAQGQQKARHLEVETAVFLRVK